MRQGSFYIFQRLLSAGRFLMLKSLRVFK